MKVGEQELSDRVIGTNSVLRHAAGQDKSLEWALQRFLKVVTLPFAPSDNAEVDTDYDLPDKAILLDVIIETVTLDVGETIAVGLLSSESGGDADGFVVGVSVNDIATLLGNAVVTAGSSESYMSSCTLGELLATFLAGSDAVEDVGTFVRMNHVASVVTAKSVTYTGSAGSDTAAGFIHLLILELP